MQLKLTLRIITDHGVREIDDLVEMDEIIRQVRAFSAQLTMPPPPPAAPKATQAQGPARPTPSAKKGEPKVPSRQRIAQYLKENLERPIRTLDIARDFGVDLPGNGGSRSSYNTLWRNVKDALKMVEQEFGGSWMQEYQSEGSLRVAVWRYKKVQDTLLPRGETSRLVMPSR